MVCGENFDKLLTGVFAGGYFPEALQWGGDAQFFFGFANGRGGVGFSRFEVAGCAGIPLGGLSVFPRRAFLQQHLALVIEDQYMDGSVPETGGVHVTARVAGDDLVRLVDDIEVLVVGLCRR